VAKLGALLLLISAWGCVHEPVDVRGEILKHLKSPSGIVVGQYPPHGLRVDDPVCMKKTTGSGRFLISGHCFSEARVIGEKATKDFSLEDPTPLVRERFLAELTSKLGNGNLRVVPKPVKREDASAIGTSLGIDVRTFIFSFGCSGCDSHEPNESQMQFAFGTAIDVTDVAEGRTLWTEPCFYYSLKRSEGPYRLGDLMANDGAKMKQVIAHAAEECGKELAAKLLTER